jgi:hypothetical protein
VNPTCKLLPVESSDSSRANLQVGKGGLTLYFRISSGLNLARGCFAPKQTACSMKVLTFLDAFTNWASIQSDLKAVALVGSYGREGATEGSDVDLLILTTDVAKYVGNRSWVSLFGESSECRIEDWGKVTSLRTFYTSGLEVEYGFTTLDWARSPMDAGSLRVVSDGMKILFDPQKILSMVQREVSSGE